MKGVPSPKPAMPKRITLIRPHRDERTNVMQTVDQRPMVDEPMRNLLEILNQKVKKTPENFPGIREISVPLAGPDGMQVLLEKDRAEAFESNKWVTRYLKEYAPDLKKIWGEPK